MNGFNPRFRPALAAAVLVGIALLGASALCRIARSEALVDISWRKSLEPTHGAINRDDPTPIALSLSVDGQVGQVEIAWKLMLADSAAAAGDTLVSAVSRTREMVFILNLPAMKPADYVLDLIADPHDQVPEKDEGNNRIRFALHVPNGKPVYMRCESSDGKSWKIQRVQISTSTGSLYPDKYGTRPDTARSSEYQIAVSGVVPGDYLGVLFAPSVNRQPILISSGSFEMPDPPAEIKVAWPRTTPYFQGRPSISGEIATTTGGEAGAPRWKANAQVHLRGSISNPTDRTADVQWLMRFLPRQEGMQMVERDTLLTLGALSTETLSVTGRVPMDEGYFLVQAEVRVPWPSGFEDLGEEERVASAIIPIGWIEVQR